MDGYQNSVHAARYDPSPASPGSRDEARVKVRLARLRLEPQEKAQDRQAQLKFQLEVRKLEIEAETAVRLRQLELDAKRDVPVQNVFTGTGMSSSPTSPPRAITFDISKHIALVPMFREPEVDSYFGVFERLATALQWPAEAWSLLLQCKIT